LERLGPVQYDRALERRGCGGKCAEVLILASLYALYSKMWGTLCPSFVLNFNFINHFFTITVPQNIFYSLTNHNASSALSQYTHLSSKPYN